MSNTASGTYGWSTSAINGMKPARASGSYGWNTSSVVGKRNPVGTCNPAGHYGWFFTPINDRAFLLPATVNNYYTPFRFWVEDNTGTIITKDLVVTEEQVVRVLSGPSQIQFKVSPFEPTVQMPDGSGPIQFKPWGHIVHAVKEDLNGNEIIWASGIVQPSDVDQNTSVMTLKAEGFSKYPKGLPWLVNFNPFAIDPAQIILKIWQHIQSFPNGNLNVSVYPATTGTEMLPGFSMQNDEFVQNFFAIFIRESDRNDCGDYIDKICRDIPIEFKEESVFNSSTNKVDKFIHLSYPKIGTYQNGCIFRLGENVRSQTKKVESEINWLSDITIKGYFPGVEYDAQVSNPDPARFRRVMDEQDLHIDSNERAAAWAHKLLTRRQIPKYYDELIVDPYHYSAPFTAYDVGDFVRVQGIDSWTGPIDFSHKIMMIAFDGTKQAVQLKLMAEGAFNYDPIEYVQPGATP
jgi:hypothetical protein